MVEPDGVGRDPETVRKESLDTAWRIHGALVDWTGKVDSKASFALTIESALLLGIVAFSKEGGALSQITGSLQLFCFRAGFVAVVLAIISAAFVVMPRLRMRHVGKEWRDNFVYFGHLKYWTDHDALSKKIMETDMLPILSRQHQRVAAVAWKKHVLLKVSLYLAMLGGILEVLAAVIPR